MKITTGGNTITTHKRATWLAAMLLAPAMLLALALAACTGNAGQAEAKVPGEVVAAGEDIAKSVRGTKDIDAVELSYQAPFRGSGSNGPITGDAPWAITLTVQLAPAATNPEAVAAAGRAGTAASRGAEKYGWVVRMEDGGRDAAAVIHQSAPGAAAEAGALRSQYIAAARNYRALPGVWAVSIDGDGTVTTTVKDFSTLGELARQFQGLPVSQLVVAAPQGDARLSFQGSWFGEDFLALLTTLGTKHPVSSMSVQESARLGERMLRVQLPTEGAASAAEKAIQAAVLTHAGGQVVVRDYVIGYGTSQAGLNGGLGTPMLAGQLRHMPELPDPDEPPAPESVAPAYTPPAYVESPACKPGQLSGGMEGRVEAALGHRAMQVVLRNLGAESCSVNGYPSVKFQDGNGQDMAVTLLTGGSYLFSDPGPAPISLAPGGTAWAFIHWGANSTAYGDPLAASMEVAPGGGGGFAGRSALADNPDIVVGTELVVSAWSWPDASNFR